MLKTVCRPECAAKPFRAGGIGVGGRSRTSGPFSRYGLLVVSLSLAILLCACGSDDAMKYDPENYKSQIQTIESLLSKPAVEPGDGGKLHKYSAELAKAVGQDIQNHTQKQTVMNVIISFGEVFAHQEEQEIPWDMSQARELWKQVRSNLFQQADWFHAL